MIVRAPPGGSVQIQDSAGNTIFLQVNEDGTLILPQIDGDPQQSTVLCFETGTGVLGPCTPTAAIGPTGPSGSKFDIRINGTSIDNPAQDLAYLGFTGNSYGFLSSTNYQFQVVDNRLQGVWLLYSGANCTGTSAAYAGDESGGLFSALPGTIFQTDGSVYFVNASATIAPFNTVSFFNVATSTCTAFAGVDPSLPYAANNPAVTGYSVVDPNNLAVTFIRN